MYPGAGQATGRAACRPEDGHTPIGTPGSNVTRIVVKPTASAVGSGPAGDPVELATRRGPESFPIEVHAVSNDDEDQGDCEGAKKLQRPDSTAGQRQLAKRRGQAECIQEQAGDDGDNYRC